MFGFLKKSADKQDATATADPVTAPEPSWRDRLKAGLARTRAQFGGKLKSIFSRGKVDDELLEELETLLLTSDVGMDATQYLLGELKLRAKRDNIDTPEAIQNALADSLYELLLTLEQPLDITAHRPFIIMIAGVNGAGKTTSIGKLAKHFQAQGLSVLLAAGDTFRAAAREQLQAWGERNNVTVISQESGDPAAVVFDALDAAIARHADILIADTDEADRFRALARNRRDDAALGRAVEFGEHQTRHVDRLVEGFDLLQRVLPEIRVEHEQGFVRAGWIGLLDHAPHLGDLFHQVQLRRQTSRRVGQHDVDTARPGCRNGIEDDGGRIARFL